MFIRDAWFFGRGLRSGLVGIGLVAAGAAQGQISNAGSALDYNNLQQGYERTDPPVQFGVEQQYLVQKPTAATNRSIASPGADYVFTNPDNSGFGHLTGSSSADSVFHASAGEATLKATGFATARTITADSADDYASTASIEADLYLHLDSPALATFDLTNFVQISSIPSELPGCNYGGYGADTFAGSLPNSGGHTVTQLLGAGDHVLYMYFYTDNFAVTGPVDQHSVIGGDMSIDVKAVPEPSTIAIFGIGALGLLGRRRRRH